MGIHAAVVRFRTIAVAAILVVLFAFLTLEATYFTDRREGAAPSTGPQSGNFSGGVARELTDGDAMAMP